MVHDREMRPDSITGVGSVQRCCKDVLRVSSEFAFGRSHAGLEDRKLQYSLHDLTGVVAIRFDTEIGL